MEKEKMKYKFYGSISPFPENKYFIFSLPCCEQFYSKSSDIIKSCFFSVKLNITLFSPLFNEKSPYTSTISARYYKDGSEILVEQKGKNPRKLTPREAARLQGFPDDFKLVVSDLQCYKQFGNSVPTKMIEAVANNVIKALKDGGEID